MTAERRLDQARALLREREALLRAEVRRVAADSRRITDGAPPLPLDVLCDLARLYDGARADVRHAERAALGAEFDPVTGRAGGDGIAGAEAAIRADVAAMRAKMEGR